MGMRGCWMILWIRHKHKIKDHMAIGLAFARFAFFVLCICDIQCMDLVLRVALDRIWTWWTLLPVLCVLGLSA